jgi:pimeloyl-ACP methyl ester carboxylesterase
MPMTGPPFKEPTRRRVGELLLALSALSFPFDARAQEQDSDKVAKAASPSRAGHNATAWLTLPPTPTLPRPARSGHASVNGASVFYAQFGEGPPVLLLHGGLGNSNYWGSQVEALAKIYTVTVMDTRGHGRSPVMSRSFGYRQFAEDVAALLDQLGIERTAIIGWSDGAITGLELAMSRPDRVSKLFAFGANKTVDGLIPAGSRSRTFAAYVERCKGEYPHLSPHPERWPQLMEGLRAMWRSEPSFTKQRLATIKAPTAIADGEHDEIIKREHTEQMSRDVPGAKLVLQPGASHFAMLQSPAEFNTIVIEFLAG